MSEVDKATVRRIPLEGFNEGRLDIVDEVFAADFINHATLPPGLPPGREGLKAFIAASRSAFPDYACTVLHEIGEGDLTVLHVSCSGTMKGDFAGMKASGKSATWEEVHILRMQGGKAVEHWPVVDELGMLQQLGFAPESEAQAA